MVVVPVEGIKIAAPKAMVPGLIIVRAVTSKKRGQFITEDVQEIGVIPILALNIGL